jgi:hypothetical protein
MRARFLLVAAVACSGRSNDRPADRSEPADPVTARPAATFTGGLATPAEQHAALDAFQGRWRFPWTISSAPADAKETVWNVAGTAFEITDGSRHRAFTVQIVAPCLARLVGPRVENPFIPFLLGPDGVRIAQGGALGFRRGAKIVLCSATGSVFVQDGSACSATRFGWDGEASQPLTVTCERRRTGDLDEIAFHHGEFTDAAHFTGDELSMTPLPAPTRPMR